jgi:hypothetical protein
MRPSGMHASIFNRNLHRFERLTVPREHAYLLPKSRHLPFNIAGSERQLRP